MYGAEDSSIFVFQVSDDTLKQCYFSFDGMTNGRAGYLIGQNLHLIKQNDKFSYFSTLNYDDEHYVLYKLTQESDPTQFYENIVLVKDFYRDQWHYFTGFDYSEMDYSPELSLSELQSYYSDYFKNAVTYATETKKISVVSYDSMSAEEQLSVLQDSYKAWNYAPNNSTKLPLQEQIEESNQISTGSPSESDLKMAVQNSAYGTISDWAYYDYDGDGKKEAFAVIGETVSDWEQSIYAIYFVDHAGNVTLVRDEFWGAEYGYGNSADNTVDGRRYFSVATDNGTIHSQAYIFSVVDGKPKEFLKNEYYDYFDTKNNQLTGYADVYLDEGGFITEEHKFTYNKAKADLEEIIQNTEKSSETPWKSAYIEYIDDYVAKDAAIKEAAEFYFLDINGDSIPEIHIQSGYGYGGSLMLTYNTNSDTVSDLQEGNSSGVKFVKGKNVFDYSGGHMDVYYDHIYKIENGRFTSVAEGDYGAEDNSHIEVDEEGNPVYRYYWNQEEISKSEYQTNLDNLVNSAQAKYFDDVADAYSYSDIKDAIKNYS